MSVLLVLFYKTVPWTPIICNRNNPFIFGVLFINGNHLFNLIRIFGIQGIRPGITSHQKGLKAQVHEVFLPQDILFQDPTLLIDKTHPAFS
jgi:hypothetical protein